MKEKRISKIKAKISELKAAEIAFKPEWGADVAKVGGKMFAYIGDDDKGRDILTVKGEPEFNEFWREKFPESVTAGYYMNKIHWNSYSLNSEELMDEDFLTVLEEAYKLQFSQLPKKIQNELVE